jgi:hypothetical protein
MMKRKFFRALAGIAAGLVMGVLAGCPNPTESEPSSDAALKSLSLSSGTLNPAFDPKTTKYTASVGYGVDSVTVTAEANHGGAKVANPAAEGQALNVGANTIAITVTAEDGKTIKTYAITVTRAGDVSDSGLVSLEPDHGSLQPAFDPDTLDYVLSVLNTVEAITITVQAAQGGATVVNPAAEGKALNVGANTIAITVTSEDGASKKIYTIVVTRQPEEYQASNDATLKALTLSAGTLAPAFAPETTDYAADVDYDVDSVTVTAEANNAKARVVANYCQQVKGNSLSAV